MAAREQTGPVAEAQARPTVVTVMAEHGVEDPVRDRPHGTGSPLDLAATGVRAELAARLRAWNERSTAHGLTDDWSDDDQRRWRDDGLGLALALQDELWDVEVRSFDGDPAERDLPRERRHRRPRSGR